MKRFYPVLLCLPLVLVIALPVLRAEDETVTVPKSRLEELERKAAELDRLQGQLEQSKAEQGKLRDAKAEAERKAAEQIKAAAAAKAEAEKEASAAKKSAEDARAIAAAAQSRAPAVYTAPPIATLAPLKPGEPVSSMDLLAHYAGDPATATARYGTGRITVVGEIVGFNKPPFVMPYEVLLKTGDPLRRVVCSLQPPTGYKAVYPAKSGTALVGVTTRSGEVTLLRVGQTVTIEGQCGGLHGPNLVLNGGVLKPAP